MKIILDMGFKDSASPDFGSIERSNFAELTLLEDDKTKLNSALTRTACASLLESGQLFNIPSGCNAVIADAPAVWRYHEKSDTWYEVIPEDED